MDTDIPFDEKLSLLRLAFKGLEDHELQEIAALTEYHTYPPDYILCHEGLYENLFVIVSNGSIVVSKKIGDSEGERILRYGGRGDLVGEMALIQNEPRSATVRTTTPCTVLEMEKSDFDDILRRSPHMALAIISITLDRMRENDMIAIAELQKTNKMLRQLDRNKTEFIQVAAHELRTPLTVLKGYANMLSTFPELKSNPSLSSVMNGVVSGTDRIYEVVNLMLDVTRMDTDTLQIKPAVVPLKPVIGDLVHGFQTSAKERRIDISVHHGDNVPDIYADPSMVQKALYHLIVNAIKFTPDGGKVDIGTRTIQMENQIPGVEIAVRDTGIGLDAEHHELVFEKFYQVGSVALHSSGKTTYKGGGAGLGLAIVRGVARAHGGKTWVESQGHDEVSFPGSTFYLQLPVNPRFISDTPAHQTT